MSNVRVRFAPSPTGYLHVGGARTALYNYLFAKKMKKLGNQAAYILRIEDTDLERSTEESLRMQMHDLKWLALDWDEGPDFSTLQDRGEYAPYRQSQRLAIYDRHVEKLLSAGRAYRCYHSDQELEQEQSQYKTEGVFLHHCDNRDRNQAQDKPFAVRLKIPRAESEWSLFKNVASTSGHIGNTREIYFHQDLVRGEVSLPFEMVGDFVIKRSNGMPVYNFCCAVDDFEMKITHVFRAEEHLNNTLRQFWVFAAICPERDPYEIMPKYGHMSIILGPDKQKLSKRHGATSCNEYMLKGYLPEAVNNYIALLGWSPGDDQEIFTREQLIDKFSADRFIKSAAVFDETKLRWVNATHLRALPALEVWTRAEPLFAANGLRGEELASNDDERAALVEIFKPSIETLCDFIEKLKSLLKFTLTDEGREAMLWESSKALVEKWVSLVEAGPERMTAEGYAKIQEQIKVDCNVKGKFLFMPMRVCVIGQPHGVDIQKIIGFLPKSMLLKRAQECLLVAASNVKK